LAPHEGEEGSRAAAEAEAQARRMAYGRSLSAGSNRAQRVADDARSRSVMLGYQTPYTFHPGWHASGVLEGFRSLPPEEASRSERQAALSENQLFYFEF